MELSWSTFILEIINFLVLVWLLKRFLYKPVREVIARRQAGIEKTMTEADAKYAEATKLQQQYESRLADWQHERQTKREALQSELNAESNRQREQLQVQLQQDREKAEVAAGKRQFDQQRKMEETALKQSARFASKLLQDLAGPETESRLIDKLLTDLEKLKNQETGILKSQNLSTPDKIEICSAYSISDEHKQQLEQALKSLTGQDIPVHYKEESSLIAGLRVSIGSWVINANIQQELNSFAELSHEE